ncbi:IQ calmodulin-binding motif protein [Aspergillus mulundensis]|uniref:IQ calmodulin-binding motif protein n=1 Tax=Aspergillus mulundensis TaxID=1810919 RepID=A0A3D8QH01_9EURO|nr:hypothetical protein DSM5745_10611 [Aspergillus mulundensis]RDW61113.1 hypothetical protein DSM5745_10611 [Aspergillus mulundensis]
MTDPELDRGDAGPEDDVTASQVAAVCLIQRVYRGYRTRRELQGRQLTATNRWIDTVREAQSQDRHHSATSPARSPAEQAHRNWSHAVNVAKLARGDSYSRRRETSIKPTKPAPATVSKAMDLQYFLEMMDPNHRHGSNLRKYHEHWKTTDSHENFFYWLDYGAGKDVELPACPRDKLAREQVRYLSREERVNYLVKVDEKGRFRWARNNELVWTNDAMYEDGEDGILPVRTLSAPGKESPHARSIFRSRPRSASGSLLDKDVSKSDQADHPRGLTDRRRHIANHIKDRLFSSDDWWIFVADPSYRLYVGIKKRGSFQHSSFLRGGRIAAAGLIKIRQGKLRDLAPLSGHYRPRSSNFHAFFQALRDQGADLSRVSTTKLYATLAGMEGYVGTKRKVIKAREKMERKIHHAGKNDESFTVDL